MSPGFEDVNVLVVDGHPLEAEDLAQTLMSKGYNVRTAYDAETALLAASIFRPDALICEIVMPDVSGIELADQLSTEYPECKVLLTSDREAVIEVMEDVAVGGSVRFLRKPLDPMEVFDFLAMCLPSASHQHSD